MSRGRSAAHSPFLFVAQGLTIHPERSADRGHRFGRRRTPNAGALDINSLAIDPAERDFGVANRLCDHELPMAIANEPEVASLAMHRLAGVDRLRPLCVDQE